MMDFLASMDIETKTKHGIHKVDIMVRMIHLMEGNKPRSEFNRFKSFLVSQINRGITAQEELDLAEGILNYIKSDAQTNERLEAMDYLFELKFLND